MNEHIVEVYMLRESMKHSLHLTQGTDAIPIRMVFKDYMLLPGTTAVAFINKPSGKGISTAAEVDLEQNSIMIDTQKQMTAEIGISILQLVLKKDEKTILTFEQPLEVHRGKVKINSENGDDFFTEYMKKITEATDAANKAREDIEEAAANGNFSATVEIGATVTGEPNSMAKVENVGTKKDVILNFQIPEGQKGESGIMVPSSGMFSLWVDLTTGNLFADYPDGSEPPEFILEENGDLKFVTNREDDGTVATVLIGNVRHKLADTLTIEEPGKYALDAHQGFIIGGKIDKILELLKNTISTEEE